jgi:hypothetical protein
LVDVDSVDDLFLLALAAPPRGIQTVADIEAVVAGAADDLSSPSVPVQGRLSPVHWICAAVN